MRYSEHVKQWAGCKACPYHVQRTNVVLARGQLPCDILFIGEAPGRSEDVTGLPFVGDAGTVQDTAIQKARSYIPGSEKVRLAFTNIIACLPIDEDGDIEDPEHSCIEACFPRLVQLVKIASPKIVVAVGDYAQVYLTQKLFTKHSFPSGIKIVNTIHPAAVLRANIAHRGLMIQKSVLVIASAMREILAVRPSTSTIATITYHRG